MDQLLRASESVLLNIAEGNGRRTESDHRQFLDLAESALLKVSTYVRLSHRTGEIAAESVQRGLALLDRVALLVRGLAGTMAELD